MSRLPPDLRPYLVGDLAEEHAERRARHGRLRADAWYWIQAATLSFGRLDAAARPLNGRWARDAGDATSDSLPRGALSAMLTQDVRYAIRRLARSPGFTAVAVLSLALGIGANSALFTLVNAIFLQDPGIREPERVVQLYQTAEAHDYWAVSYGQLEAIQDELPDVFSHVTGFQFVGLRTEPTGDEVVPAMRVVGDYFGVMGVAPALGRPFQPGVETDVEDPPPVAVVSHDFWTSSLGADAEAVGSTVRINARPTTIVGVLPPDFTGKASGIEVHVLVPDPGAVRSPGVDNLFASARLRDGVSPEQARAGLANVATRLNQDRPSTLRRIGFTIVPETEVAVHPFLDRWMVSFTALLFGVVALVLLIACTNLASFLLARAADRRKEFAVRRAMGAGRGRIVTQLLAESTLLGLLGGAAGVAFAWISLRALLAAPPLAVIGVAIELDIAPDLRVVAFTTGVALLAGLVFGLVPALTAGREQVAPVLRDEAGAVAGGSRRKVSLRGSLVGAQVALSLLLLMSAGLFLRSLWAASSVDPGFDRREVAMITVDPATTGYDEEGTLRAYDELLRRVRALPGVTSAAVATRIPLELGNWRRGIRRPDVEPVPGREFTYPQVAYVSEGYFETLGIELLSGRGFSPADATDAPEVVVVNEALAHTLWPDERDVVGRTVRLQGVDADVTIVGVSRTTLVSSLDEAPTPYLYVPVRQSVSGTAWIMARAAPERAVSLPVELRREAKAIDQDLYVHTPGTAEDVAGLVLYLPRMGGLLLGTFGALALVMAAVGLWGVVSYAVARREKEVGIRLSLGAEPAGVVRLMMRGGMRVVVVGAAVGIVLALGVGVLLERFLFGVRGIDPLTFVGVPLVLLGVAALASWLPARRAARVDPMTSLRSE